MQKQSALERVQKETVPFSQGQFKPSLKLWVKLYTSQNNGNKSKNKQMGLIKLKNFCTTKETISKVKGQPSEWEKMIANETMDK